MQSEKILLSKHNAKNKGLNFTRNLQAFFLNINKAWFALRKKQKESKRFASYTLDVSRVQVEVKQNVYIGEVPVKNAKQCGI